jgi:hypothetical protein
MTCRRAYINGPKAAFLQYALLVCLVVLVAGGSDWIRSSYWDTVRPSVADSQLMLKARGALPIPDPPQGMASNGGGPVAEPVSLWAASILIQKSGADSRDRRRSSASTGVLPIHLSERGKRLENVTTSSGAVHSELAQLATLVGAKPSGTS